MNGNYLVWYGVRCDKLLDFWVTNSFVNFFYLDNWCVDSWWRIWWISWSTAVFVSLIILMTLDNISVLNHFSLKNKKVWWIIPEIYWELLTFRNILIINVHDWRHAGSNNVLNNFNDFKNSEIIYSLSMLCITGMIV